MKIFIDVDFLDTGCLYTVSFEGNGLSMDYYNHDEHPQGFQADIDIGIYNRVIVRQKDDGEPVLDLLDHGYHNLNLEYEDFMELYFKYREEIEATLTLIIQEKIVEDVELEIY